jgi:hypothetical protein
VGVASASFVRQGDEPVGADDYVVEKRNPNELADLAQPSRQLDVGPGRGRVARYVDVNAKLRCPLSCNAVVSCLRGAPP